MSDVAFARRLLRQWESPPTWLALFLILAWAQSRFLPLLPVPYWLRLIGLTLIVCGAALLVASAVGFRRHATTILPREVPRAMITTGPYSWSRNPIYLGDALMLAGATLAWDAASLPLVPAFMAVIARRFIAGEEAGMRAAFGSAFDAYAARVRRWA
jgi:protein-S-isoprenylcysteine O-methyltransferase Ste14